MRGLPAVLLLCLSAQVAALCERPLKVAAEHWPPYSVLSEDGWQGTDVDRVRALLRRAGCEVIFMDTPPGRSHVMLEKGEVDILMAASDVPERHRYALFSKPYRREVMAVFALAGRDDLPGGFPALLASDHTLVAPRSGWYGEAFAAVRGDLIGNHQLIAFDYTHQAVSILAAGRADLLMGDQQSILITANNLGVKLSQRWIANDAPVHLMLSRTSLGEAHLQRINAALSP